MPSRRFILIAAALIAAACSDAADRLTSPDDPQSSLGLPNHATADTLVVGATKQLTASLTSRRGRTRATETVWTSSNTSVATVTNNGLVTALAAGSTVIRAANNIESEQATIVVLAPAAQGPTAADTTTPPPSGDPATPPVDTTTPPSHGDPAPADTTAATGGSPTPTAPTGQTPPPAAPADTTSTGTTTPPPPYSSTFAAPALPQAFVNTAPVPVTGTSIVVPAGGNFQAALDAALPGDEIVLAAGATYTGNFGLRNKSGTGWITIRGSAPSSSLPAAGQRMTPAYASALPKIVSPNAMPALATYAGAHNFRFVGVEVAYASGITSGNTLIEIGTSYPAPTTLAGVPRDFIFERVYVHGNATISFSRCIALNAASAAVIDSWLSECHSSWQDSQAILVWNGPGPFKIVNNFLEGAGENVMFGGGDPSVQGMVPSDIEIRRNHFFKPLSWQGSQWVIKNLFELKNARRVLVEGNVFENNWGQSQNGFALLWKSENQDGTAPWTTTSDLTFQYNIVRNVAGAINMAARGSPNTVVPAARFRIAHNVFERIGDPGLIPGNATGRLFQWIEVQGVELAHNTGVGTTHGLLLIGAPTSNALVLRDNIIGGGPAIGSADGQGWGTKGLDYHVPGWVVRGNTVLGAPVSAIYPYPPNNVYASSASAAGLSSDLRPVAAPSQGSYTTDGQPVGADRSLVDQKTAGVVQ